MSVTGSARAEKPDLSGLRVLLVEDEYFLADDLCQVLQRCGAEVVGPVPSLAKAMPLAENEDLTCAILDINLRGESGLVIAEALHRRNVPFIYTTGYRNTTIAEALKGAAHLEKPFRPEALLDAVAEIARRNSIL
ncbi:response regulator [Microvirga zambiensis]|uniref:response regulator n=1 Tax=Microvirga zambiensis TaxID=1402137 RepID=UPI00191E81AB|nr:response regulator [Microvirga zambiensis]